MSRNQRFTLLGLAVVVLIVAFVLARSGGNDSNDSSSTDTTAAQTSGGGTDTGDTAAKPKPTVPTVVVRDAKPVGGVKRISFKHNDQIVFVVKSDTADEIHFHGYDIGKDVKAGGSVRFATKGTIEGRFEVELENHKEQIAEVEVTP